MGMIYVSHSIPSNNQNDSYNNKILIIEAVAKQYANDNEETIFAEGKRSVTIYVKDLIKSGYLAANENGDLEDPRDINKKLNNLKIIITKKNNKIEAKVKS
jgi:hypothetical protein